MSKEIEAIATDIVDCAFKVHKEFGPGLLESAYRVCLAYELRKRGFDVIEERPVPVVYDDVQLDCGFRADLIMNGLIVVELKAKSQLHPVDEVRAVVRAAAGLGRDRARENDVAPAQFVGADLQGAQRPVHCRVA